MKIVGKIISFAVKMTLLVSVIVFALELIDNLHPGRSSRYLFTEDFLD